MNSIKRLILGGISSFLLAIGFSRAADRLDPLTNSINFNNGHESLGVAQPCTWPCEVALQPR